SDSRAHAGCAWVATPTGCAWVATPVGHAWVATPVRGELTRAGVGFSACRATRNSGVTALSACYSGWRTHRCADDQIAIDRFRRRGVCLGRRCVWLLA